MHSLILRLGLLTLFATVLLALPGAVAEAAFPGTNGLIAFERGGDIYTVTTDSTPTVSSSPLVSNASEPAWSPDGTKLAYVEAGTSAITSLDRRWGAVSRPSTQAPRPRGRLADR